MMPCLKDFVVVLLSIRYNNPKKPGNDRDLPSAKNGLRHIYMKFKEEE